MDATDNCQEDVAENHFPQSTPFLPCSTIQTLQERRPFVATCFVFDFALVLFSKNPSTTWGLSTRKTVLISGKLMPMIDSPILEN
jgi:hypothetical protein